MGPSLFRHRYDARLIDLSVSDNADDLAQAATKNISELGQINREQTDSLRAALKSRSLQLHCWGPQIHERPSPAPEHISLQAKYLEALPECRARCQTAEASFSQAFQRFKVLVCKATTLWAPCWQHSRQRLSTPLSFPFWSSRSVRWHGVFLGRKACVFEGGHTVKKLGAALALCPPIVIQVWQRRLMWFWRQLLWEQSTGHRSPLQIKTDVTLSPTVLRLPVMQPRGCWAPADLADLEHGSGTRPMAQKSHQMRIFLPQKMSQCPQCGKKFTTISNARVHIKRQSCSRSKSCNVKSIFHNTHPEQPRPKTVCAPVVSNTAPNALFLTDDLLKSDKKRKKVPEGTASALTSISERDNPTISLEQ